MNNEIDIHEIFLDLKGENKENLIAKLELEASKCGKFLRKWQEIKKQIYLESDIPEEENEPFQLTA